VREKFLKLNKERSAIVNAYDEVLYLRRERNGNEVYVAPSSESKICQQVAPKEVPVCVEWEGDQCTSWEECTSREVIEVEICVNFGLPETKPQNEYWHPPDGIALKL
jgi:hypothetical protein